MDYCMLRLSGVLYAVVVVRGMSPLLHRLPSQAAQLPSSSLSHSPLRKFWQFQKLPQPFTCLVTSASKIGLINLIQNWRPKTHPCDNCDAGRSIPWRPVRIELSWTHHFHAVSGTQRISCSLLSWCPCTKNIRKRKWSRCNNGFLNQI